MHSARANIRQERLNYLLKYSGIRLQAVRSKSAIQPNMVPCTNRSRGLACKFKNESL